MAEARIRMSAEDRTPEGFRSVERRLREFGANVKSLEGRINIFSGLRAGILGVGAALGSSQLLQTFRQTVNAADELNAVSQRVGIAAESLSELKFAAEINNLAFEDLQTGLRSFAKAIDENSEAFDRIGLDPKTFKDLDDGLNQVADKFARIKNPIEASALALQLFGRSGNNFVEFLRLGSGGIEQFREEARKLNVVITSDFAKAADEYNDNITRIGAAWQGVKNQLAASVLPFFADLSEELLIALKVAGSFGGAIDLAARTSPGANPVQKIREVEDQVISLERELDSLKAKTKDTFDLADNELDFFGSGANEIDRVNKQLDETRKKLEYLRGLRDIQIRNDPKLQALAETGRGVRENTQLQNFGELNVKPSRDGGSSGSSRASARQSDFDILRRSLEAQLTRERDLTAELTLVEDVRFQKLKSGQQDVLRSIAQRVDTLKLEKIQKETVEESISIERDLREVAAREEIASIEERKSALLRDYEDRKISAQEYYSFVAGEETRAILVRQRELELNAEIERARAGDIDRSAPERLNAAAREIDIRQQIADLERQQADVEVRNARAAAQADEAMLDRKVDIARQLNQIQGIQNVELDRLAIEREFRDLDEDFKRSVTFQVFLDTKLAEQQLAAFEQSGGVIEQRLRLTEERVNIDRDTGISTESEAREKVLQARRQAAEEIEKEILKLEDLRKAQGLAFGPEQEARITAQKNRLAELKATTEDYLRDVREIGQEATANFFSDLIKGGEDAINAVERLGDAIENNIANRIGSEISDQLFAGFGQLSKGGGLPDGGLLGLIGSGAKEVGGFFGLGGNNRNQQSSFGGQGSDGLNADASARATDAISQAANEGASVLGDLSSSVLDSQSAVDQLTGSLLDSAPSVSNSLAGFASSTILAQAGSQALSTALPSAAASAAPLTAANQLASVEATKLGISLQLLANEAIRTALAFKAAQATSGPAGSLFSAKGNVFEGGYAVPFAKGGVIDDGAVRAFAKGGMVSSPTFFPMADGRTGLMGEAGPEAIMPAAKSGVGFSLYAIGASGTSQTVPIARDMLGRLAVDLSSLEVPQFALGGVFDGGYLADLPLVKYASGGIANRPQVALFGEGSRPEAFVPLPDGKRIPVDLEDQSERGGITLVQNITTDDAASFRRSRSAIYNEANAGLGTAASRI